MLIAIPSQNPGGLEAEISDHFGHCDAFTIVTIEEGAVGEVTVLPNTDHAEGGCLAPIQTLAGHGVEVLVAGGMGARPLAGFQQAGIAVHFKEDAASVGAAVELFLAGGCRCFGEAQTCGGGGGGCGGHHQHEPVEREPIEGPADVRDGRIVTFDYELTDAAGTLLDSSRNGGPMRYLHGAQQLLPALERALAGLESGGHVVAEIPPTDGFGERDDSSLIEVARAELPSDAVVGSMITAEDANGRRMPLIVVALDDTTARLDGNHPFAGKHLVFDVTVLDVESATADELAHGHVH